MSNASLEDYIKILSAIAKINPENISLIKNRSAFPEIQQFAVASIANSNSWSEAVENYDAYHALIPNWNFVFASHEGEHQSLSAHREFSEGSVVRGLFKTKFLKVLDSESRRNGENIPVDYSISLDTQALSYLTPYINGQISKLPLDYYEIFEFISNDNVYVDAMPYILENLPNALDKNNIEKIRFRLKGYEILRSLDTNLFKQNKEIRSKLSDAELQWKVDNILNKMISDASDVKKLDLILNQHKKLYALLLKMTTIQLKGKHKTIKDKILEFMDFLDQKIYSIFAREVIIAATYFEKDRDLLFFKKIQKTSPEKIANLLDSLKNMAWDFLHIRHIEFKATIGDEYANLDRNKARYFFPSLLTCDKNFIEIIDLYPLKSYAFDESGKIHPFPDMDWFEKLTSNSEDKSLFIERYYSNSAVKRRNDKCEEIDSNINNLISVLEKDFSDAAIISNKR